MYSIKEACKLTDMTYETLKFYCNEGLVPNVRKRGIKEIIEYSMTMILNGFRV